MDKEFAEIREKIKALREMRQTAREDIAKYEEGETSYFTNISTSQTQDSPSIKLYVVVGPR